MILTAVFLALGVFSLLNLAKSLVAWHLLPGAKLLAGLVFSTLGATVFTSSVADGVLLTGATFGLATTFHAAHKAIGAAGDYYRAATLRTLNR